MKAFIGMTKRNMLIYFKDRMAVFFSVLTPILIFLLYVLFLRKTFVDGLTSAMESLEGLISKSDIDAFANLILLAGVIASSVITVAYSSLSTIVSDRQGKIDYDISATPMSRISIVLSYMLAGFLTTLFVTVSLLTAGLIIISIIGNTYLTVGRVFALYGITALGSLSSTALFMILMCLFKTSSQSGAFQGLLCAGAGFIIGAYIPISQFASPVQTFANLFPGSHIAALYRDTLLSGVLDHMNQSIGGLDNGEFVKAVTKEFALNLNMFGNTLSKSFMLVYPLILIGVCTTIFGILYQRVYKRK